MHILYPVAFIFGSLILDAQSCIFNEHEGKLSLSAIKNDLSSFSFLPFCISTFLLFSLHHHHHHISIVFPPPPPPPHFLSFIDLKVTRSPKPTKNSTRPYLNEISAHFTHEIKTKGYDVIGVNVFLCKLMKFLRKKVE